MIEDSSKGQTDGFGGATDDALASELTDELRARVKGELEPGERVLWAGPSSPPPRAPLGRGCLIAGMIALVLLVGGIIIIAMAMGDTRAYANRESPMPFGIILCVAGCVTMLGTIAYGIEDRLTKCRQGDVFYAVTDRRAISWVPEPKTDAVRIRSVPLGHFGSVVRIERPDGSGSLEMTYKNPAQHNWSTYSFQHVPEIRRVEQIVRNNLMRDEGGQS